MARTLIWTETALQDLDEAAEYIARDSKFYAKAFVKESRQAARSLKRFPERGRIVPELGEPEIREIFVRSYRLIYKLEDTKRIYVVRFIHGARDFSARWSQGTP
jgi:addiction module RelE/StbE family toxin